MKKEDAIHFLMSNATGQDTSGGLYDDVSDGNQIVHVEAEVRSPYILYHLTTTYPDGTGFHSGLQHFNGVEEMRKYLGQNICRGAGKPVTIE